MLVIYKQRCWRFCYSKEVKVVKSDLLQFSVTVLEFIFPFICCLNTFILLLFSDIARNSQIWHWLRFVINLKFKASLYASSIKEEFKNCLTKIFVFTLFFFFYNKQKKKKRETSQKNWDRKFFVSYIWEVCLNIFPVSLKDWENMKDQIWKCAILP